MIIIQFAAIVFIYLLMYEKSRDLVRALANAWILITFFIWGITECLSVFGAYTREGMLVAWGICLLLTLCLLCKHNIKKTVRSCIIDNEQFKCLWEERKVQIALFAIFSILILVGSGLRSLNNTDSSIYHLPRIMHWIQNKSVWPYAAGKDLQIRYPSLTEYLVAQVFFDGLPDRLASLPQAVAFLATGGMIYGICRRMQVSVKLSYLASYLFYCAPMALAQSFTTQTDDVAGMFLIVYVYFLLDFMQKEKLSSGTGLIRDGVRLAICVMLGYLCKPTICFVMVVFFVWMCIVRLKKRDRVSLLLQYIVVGVASAAILFIPLLVKTYDIYYTPKVNTQAEEIADTTENVTSDEKVYSYQKIGNTLAPDSSVIIEGSNSPKKIFMTLLMNYCRSSTSAVFPKWNVFLNKIVNEAGELLHYDVSRFAIQDEEGFFHHDTASNPTILLGMIVMCFILLLKRCNVNRLQLSYILCAVVGLIVQCGFMTYTLYRGRYLVGCMAVLCPAFAITIENLKVKSDIKKNISVAIVVLASIGALNVWSYEILHMRDGFTGKHVHQYLIDNTWLENEFSSMFDYINANGYKTVGMYGGFTYEYLAWREISDLDRLEAVNVQYQEYQKYEDQTFYPECIIRDNTDSPEEIIECHGKNYKLVWHTQAYITQFAVYVPEADEN